MIITTTFCGTASLFCIYLPVFVLLAAAGVFLPLDLAVPGLDLPPLLEAAVLRRD